MKKLSDEIESLRNRAEQAERELQGYLLHNNNHNSSNSSNNTNSNTSNNNNNLTSQGNGLRSNNTNDANNHTEEIIALKENVLRLDSERISLQNVLSQREKKIELLEEDLRGPVPFETGREKRITDLETRNAELRQQLWLAEAETEAQAAREMERYKQMEDAYRLAPVPVPVPLEPSPPALDSAAFSLLAQSVLNLIVSLGLDDSAEISERISDTSIPAADRVNEVVAAVQLCGENVQFTVNQGSDIAECMGLKGMEGEEGTLTRLRDCLEKISEAHSILSHRASDNDTSRAQLDSMIRDLELSSERTMELEDTVERLISEIDGYKELIRTLKLASERVVELESVVDRLHREGEVNHSEVEKYKDEIEKYKNENIKLIEENENINKDEQNLVRSNPITDGSEITADNDDIKMELENEIENLNRDLQELKDEIIILSQKITDSDTIIAEKDTIIAEKDTIINETDSKINDIESRINDKTDEYNDLVSSLVQLETAKNEEKIEFEQHINQLVDELEEMKQANNIIIVEKDETIETMTKEIEEIKQINATLIVDKNKYEETIKNTLITMENDQNNANNNITELENLQVIENIEKENIISALRKELLIANEEITKGKEEVAKLTEEYTALIQEHSSLSEKRSFLADAAISVYVKSVSNVESVSNEIEKGNKNDNDTENTDGGDTNNNNNINNDNNNNINNTSNEYNEILLINNDLSLELSIKATEIETLSLALDKLSLSLLEKETELTAVAATLIEKETELSAVTTALTESKAALDTLQASHDERYRQSCDKDAKIADLTEDLGYTKEDVKYSISKHEHALESYVIEKEKAEDLEDEIKILESKLLDKQSEIDSLIGALKIENEMKDREEMEMKEALEKEKGKTVERINVMIHDEAEEVKENEAISVLTDRISEKEKEIELLQEELKNIKNILSEQESKNILSTEEITKLNRLLAESHTQLEGLSVTCGLQRIEVEEGNARVTSLSQQLLSMEEMKNTLEERMNVLESEKNILENEKNTLDKEKNVLILSKQQIESENTLLENQKNILLEERNVLLDENSVLKDERNILQEKNVSLEGRVSADGLKEELLELQETLKKVTQELDTKDLEQELLIIAHTVSTENMKERTESMNEQLKNISEQLMRISEERNIAITDRNAMIAERNMMMTERDIVISEKDDLLLELSQLTVISDNRRFELLESRNQTQDAVAANMRLQEELSQVDGNAAATTQKNEILRLSLETQKLSLSLQQKESDLFNTVMALNKKEGEKAGLDSSLLSLQEEVNILRAENNDLIQNRTVELRKTREMSRELDALKATVKYEKEEKEELENVLRMKNVLSHTPMKNVLSQPSTPGPSNYNSKHELESEDLQSSRSALLDVLLWLETKINFTLENSGISGSHSGISGPGGNVTFLSPHKTPVKNDKIDRNDRNVDRNVDRDERSLNVGARTPSPYRVHFADTDNNRNSHSNSHHTNSHSNSHTSSTDTSDITTLVARTKQLTGTALTEREVFISKQQALLLVIEKQLEAAQLRLQLEVEGAGQAILRSPAASSSSTPTRSPGAYALVTAALSKSASPSGLEVARLHTKYSQETRKLANLQEQHSDLLGLLAQQEIELNVFRSELNSKGGEGAVFDAENKSKLASISTYGSYTNFRNLLHDNLNESGRFRSP